MHALKHSTAWLKFAQFFLSQGTNLVLYSPSIAMETQLILFKTSIPLLTLVKFSLRAHSSREVEKREEERARGGDRDNTVT